MSAATQRKHSPSSTCAAQRDAKPTRRTYLRKPTEYKESTREPKNNYAPVPHHFWGLMREEKISGMMQLTILGYLIARTWGDPDKPTWVKVTISDFARELGISSRMVELALADAIARGLIAARSAGQSRLYQVTPERWDAAPKYEAKAVAVEDDAPEEEEEDELDPAAAANLGGKLVVHPGKRSKAMPISVPIKGMQEPVKLRYSFDADVPLSVQASSGDPGALHFTVRAGSEETANNLRNAVRRSEPTVKDLAAYRDYFNPLFLSELKKPLDAPFLRQIAEAARFAPVTDFDAGLQNLRRRRILTSAMILTIARQDIGPAWEARRDAEAATQRNAAERAERFAPRLSEREVIAALADPVNPDADQWIRETYPEIAARFDARSRRTAGAAA